MLISVWQRMARSYAFALAKYLERVERGEQPSTPVVDLFNVDTQERLLVTASLSYLAIIGVLFLRMREKAEPLRLKSAILCYNIVNVCLSGYVAASIVRWKWRRSGVNGIGGGFVCNELLTDADGLQMARVFLVFYLQKYLEFGDTFFFILRKSDRQVTFLHLFHHCSITVIVGSILPFDFNGDMYLPILLNATVHVLVYFHYILTALGLHAWWSPYLTSLQLMQFAGIFLQSLVAFTRGPACGSPDFIKVLLCCYMGSMLVLFGIFFTQRYIFKVDAVDTCGVVKSLEPSGSGHFASCWHGNARLDDAGRATVRLSRTFHEAHSPVMYCYQLTPVGSAMPELHVSQEVSRTLKGHKFAVAGGTQRGVVSWMVASVPVLDRVPH